MPTPKEVYLDKKYTVLGYLSTALYVIGVLSIIMGINMFFYSKGVYDAAPADPQEAMMQKLSNPFAGMIAWLSLIGGLITGLVMIVQAEILRLFIDLEWNQRENIELQKQIIENM